ncbi:MAG TPA: hypothetical protein VF792_12020 [Ktedonobacterales bacterium]
MTVARRRPQPCAAVRSRAQPDHPEHPHNILIKHGMASFYRASFDRLLKLQEQVAIEPFERSAWWALA